MCSESPMLLHSGSTAQSLSSSSSSSSSLRSTHTSLLHHRNRIDSLSSPVGARETRGIRIWNGQLLHLTASSPDEYQTVVATYASRLRLCGHAKALADGKRVHASIIRSGHDRDRYLGNLLVEMYGDCGSLDDARSVFAGLSCPNVYSWTILIRAYAESGDGKEALELFDQMQAAGVKADRIAFICALGACASLTSLADGRSFHARIVCCGFQSDAAIGNALINMYSKCGSCDSARNVFCKATQRNAISWCAMIAACVQDGQSKEALEHFNRMQVEGIKPDKVTFISILSACASLAAQEEGHDIHASIVGSGLDADVAVGNALLNMYGKCGSLERAKTFFNKMHHRNVISWTAIITSYAQHGHSYEALELFSHMQAAGVKPDKITYIAVLTACSHAGLVDAAKCYLFSMKNVHGLTPLVEHYVCMIDLFGRAGQLDEAEELIRKMPCKCNAPAWLSLLSVCRIHGDVERGACAADNALNLDPANTSPYSQLLNIHAAAGRWNDFAKVRKARKNSCVRKERALVQV